VAALAFSNLAQDTQGLPVTGGSCAQISFSRFRYWDFLGAQLFALGIPGEYWHGTLWFVDRRPCATREHTVRIRLGWNFFGQTGT
jgi:hypothetical protein